MSASSNSASEQGNVPEFKTAAMTHGVKNFLSCLLVIISLALVYAQVATFDFINFDDNIYVTENSMVLSGLNRASIEWALLSTLGGHWHPLSWLSLMLDVTLFGPNASAMHLINLALHILNAILLFFLLRRSTFSLQVSLVSVLLFALHPLRMESVAWVSQRKDLLSLSLGLTAALLYLCYRDKKSIAFYAASVAAYALALLAKPTMITMPALLVLLDAALSIVRGGNLHAVFKLSIHRNKIPFLILAVTVACAAMASQSEGGGLRDFNDFPLSRRFDIIFSGYLTYLGKLFWPFELSVFYPIANYPSGLACGCFLSLAAISVLFWNARENAPELILSWAWFLISLLPVIGFVMIGAQAVADRWTQLAHIGPILGLTCLTLRKLPRSFSAFTILIALMAFLTFQGLPAWKNSEALFTEALRQNPNNFLAHTNLGAGFQSPEQFSSQVHHFEEAVRLNPTYPEALNNLGMVRAQEGRFTEAKSFFERALSLTPNLQAARNNLRQVNQDLTGRAGNTR